MCKILGCDRCSAFIYDKQNNELWAPSGQSSKVYRISDQNGIAGYVARTSESQNIKEVYNDPRFDNNYDIKTGYRTKTMLAVPVMGKDNDVIGRLYFYKGVLQAINKQNASKDSEIYFNIEDEGIIRVLAKILTDILHNSLLHDDREVFYQDLLKVIEVSSILTPGWRRVELTEGPEKPIRVSQLHNEKLVQRRPPTSLHSEPQTEPPHVYGRKQQSDRRTAVELRHRRHGYQQAVDSDRTVRRERQRLQS